MIVLIYDQLKMQSCFFSKDIGYSSQRRLCQVWKCFDFVDSGSGDLLFVAPIVTYQSLKKERENIFFHDDQSPRGANKLGLSYNKQI